MLGVCIRRDNIAVDSLTLETNVNTCVKKILRGQAPHRNCIKGVAMQIQFTILSHTYHYCMDNEFPEYITS